MDLRLEGDWLVVHGRGYPELKELGATWQQDTGTWRLPATRLNATALIDAYADAPDLRERLMRPYRPVAHDTLFDYQKEAVGWLTTRPRGGILVMSPGLGKTAVSIVAADRLGPDLGVLVITTASLQQTWWREIGKWGRAAHNEWEVTTWDKAARLASFSGGRDGGGLGQWDIVILDESVLAKSRRSKRYKSLRKVRKHWKRVWLLSGSPTTKYADDLWTQLSIIWPAAFKSYWRFAERYCVVEETPWSKSVVGNRESRSVMEDNGDLVLVVNQEEVLDLPEYLFEAVDVDLGPRQAKAYRTMASEFVAELEGGDVIVPNEVAKLTHLQQIASYWDGQSAKHDALMELLPGYEGPHLVWTHWREGAEALWTRLVDAGYAAAWVSGQDSARVKDQTLEDFKRGLIDVLVLSVGVGKFGHTFTNVRTVHWIDRTFNADDYFQALHRVRRIGLEHRPVSVAYRARDTVDVIDVELNLTGKLRGISRVTKAELRDLLAGLGKET